MELFDLPLDSPEPPVQPLDAATQLAVFGDLPASLARNLHTPEVGDLVLQLLDKGWRSGQVADRVGKHPVERDAVAGVVSLLTQLLRETPPDARWRAEKQQRAQAVSWTQAPEPASEQSRQEWIAQIRTELGAPKREARPPLRAVRPPCALCAGESTYFVTHEVRLCEGCVVLLGTGAVRLDETG